MLIRADGRAGDRNEVERACRAAVRALRAHGVRPGDRVLLTGANTEEFVVALFALMEHGTSVALVDRGLPPRQRARRAEEAAAHWILTDTPQPHDATGPRTLPLTALTAGTAADTDTGTDSTPLSFRRWYERTDALIVWSSGSTGEPKGIVRSGSSVRDNIRRTADRMAYRADDVLLPLLPFTHQYGLSMLLLWWTTGCSLVLQPDSHRTDAALSAIRAHRVTVVDGVPATYQSLLRVARGATDSLAPVRMWCVGGEPLRPRLREEFARTTGLPLLDGYGSSEAGNIALAVPAHPEGCGRPLDGITVRAVDETGRTLAPGEVGEIVVRTPDHMTGLLGPHGTVRPVTGPEYRTGDLGRVAADGTVTVLGRRSAVHRLGHTLYPDAIADRAGVCGTPVRVVPVDGDDGARTRLVFFVADPADRDAAHWRRTFKDRLAEHEWPNRVVTLRAFPLTSTGKVDGTALRRLARAAVAPDAERGERP
ncbi:fatty acid--CoA ligase family protein [Streptomyces sp. NPDC026672]|uniref:class I adenylate-forming enzyme family protein n=1 Tax=unclassified Streptomyces TaxID=2593676 RepID=UPI0033D6195E